jgi:hypothetical protein
MEDELRLMVDMQTNLRPARIQEILAQPDDFQRYLVAQLGIGRRSRAADWKDLVGIENDRHRRLGAQGARRREAIIGCHPFIVPIAQTGGQLKVIGELPFILGESGVGLRVLGIPHRGHVPNEKDRKSPDVVTNDVHAEETGGEVVVTKGV